VKRIALFLLVICGYSCGSELLNNNYIPGSFNDRADVLVLSHIERVNVPLIAFLQHRYAQVTAIAINNLQGNQHLDYSLAYAIITAFPHLREIEILNAEVRWKKTIELLENWQQENPRRVLSFTYKLLEEKTPDSEDLTKIFDKFEN